LDTLILGDDIPLYLLYFLLNGGKAFIYKRKVYIIDL